jgi:SAM-dependent methyltransferase
VAGVVSCVLDTHPRFHLEALRWYATLRRFAGVDSSSLVLHVVGLEARHEVPDFLRSEGVVVRPVAPFDPRSPHCNKIAGALSLARQPPCGDETCVLTDTDLVLFDDPRTIDLPRESLGMKVVDWSLPEISVLRHVFHAAGLPLPPERPVGLRPTETTLRGNGNGGLYVLHRSLLPTVADAWSRWARWLLDEDALRKACDPHSDQVALALAIAAEGISLHDLDVSWNTPIHFVEDLPRLPTPPHALHYHRRTTAQGEIRPTGDPVIDSRVEQANAATAAVWRQHFPNQTFWDWRYLTDPALGSGIGSRGQALAAKRQLLSRLVKLTAPATVLDVGCGDGASTRGLPLPGYTGLDVSAESIAQASRHRPDGTFLRGSLADHQVAADLTLCLDVLIHQAEAQPYRETVRRLLLSFRKVLLISGYERPPTNGSSMVFFHEPLSETIARFGPDLEVITVAGRPEPADLVVVRAGALPDRTLSKLRRLADRPPAPRSWPDPRRLLG